VFRIGEFARFTRVSIKMLRHYDAIGLLTPAYKDPDSGYRYYRAAQLTTLNRILLLRELGFGLDEIAGLLDHDDDALYERRERDLQHTIDVARRQLDAVRARRALIDGAPPTDVVVRPVPAMAVAILRGHLETPINERFAEVERYALHHRARADRPPLTLLDDESIAVAVPVTRELPATGRIAVEQLPPVPEMACTVHSGGYGGLARRLQQMLRWLDDTGRRPAGPVREVYLRFGAEPDLALPAAYLAESSADFVTELQVPVGPPQPTR
jgi:DNA-binding transcriptional MerR regulator